MIKIIELWSILSTISNFSLISHSLSEEWLRILAYWAQPPLLPPTARNSSPTSVTTILSDLESLNILLLCVYSINTQKMIVHSDFEIRIETKQSSNQLQSSNVINIVGRRHKVMIVSCVFRCIMHVYIDRVRKQILETIGLMTTFLICGAAFSFCVSHHCYSNTVKIFIDCTRDNFSKDFNPKLLVSVHQFIINRVSAHIGVQLYLINFNK